MLRDSGFGTLTLKEKGRFLSRKERPLLPVELSIQAESDVLPLMS
jgi:hypothetical protein